MYSSFKVHIMSSQTPLVTVVLLLMLAVLAACGGGATEPTAAPAAPAATPDPLAGWIAFTAPDGSFAVRLPEEPEIDEQAVPTEAGDIQVAMYLVEGNDRAVMLSHNEFPAAIAEAIATGDDTFIQGMLDGGRDGAVGNVSGTLQDEKQITVGGFPGREFTFSVDSSASPTGDAITGIARVILTTDRLYQLISLTAADETDPTEVRAFFDSFHLAASQ
jgi:hypothetical protein